MYNKLFTKILDSSIWLENQPTRIVWITFIACMDQDGIVALSSIGNVANRARVSNQEAEEALQCLESPDIHNPDQDHEGRRVERIPGIGWLVMNAGKYRDIVKAETARAQNRERVRRHRKKQNVMECNDDVMDTNESVTPSEAEAEADTKKKEARVNSKKQTQSDWLAVLKNESIYAHINFDQEIGKATVWIKNHPGRQLTKGFFINWINKIEAPLSVTTSTQVFDGCDICRNHPNRPLLTTRKPGMILDLERSLMMPCECRLKLNGST